MLPTIKLKLCVPPIYLNFFDHENSRAEGRISQSHAEHL